VAGGDVVVAKREVLAEAALPDMVDVDPEGPRAPEGPVQPLGADAAEHRLEQAGVDAGVMVAAQVPGVGEVQPRQGEPAGDDVFAKVGAHPRQVAKAGEVEAFVVVEQAQVGHAGEPGARRRAPLGAGRHAEFVEQEAVGPADDLAEGRRPVRAPGGPPGLPVRRLDRRGRKGQAVLARGHQRLRRRHGLRSLQQPLGAVDVQLGQGQSAAGELEAEAAHFGRGQRVQQPRDALDALLQVQGLVDLGDDDGLGVHLPHRLHLPAGVAVDLAGHAGPAGRGQAGRGLGAQRGRRRVEQLGRVELVEPGLQRQTEGQPVATLPRQVQRQPGAVAIDQPEVERRVDRLRVVQRLGLVAVAVELGLEDPGAGGRSPLQPAEQRRRAGEDLVEVGPAAEADIGHGSPLEATAQQPQRVGDVAAAAQVAPAQAERGVPVAPALAGHQVFAGEQAGAAEVAQADRDLRPAGILGAQADLEVERLVPVGLVPGQRDVGVAEAEFEPVQRLQLDAQAGVGVDVADRAAHGAGTGHARAGRLHEAQLAPVVAGQGRAGGLVAAGVQHGAGLHGRAGQQRVGFGRGLGGQQARQVVRQLVRHPGAAAGRPDPGPRAGLVLEGLVPGRQADRLHPAVGLRDPGPVDSRRRRALAGAGVQVVAHQGAGDMLDQAGQTGLVDDQHAGRARKADELVGAAADRVGLGHDFERARVVRGQRQAPGERQPGHPVGQRLALRTRQRHRRAGLDGGQHRLAQLQLGQLLAAVAPVQGGGVGLRPVGAQQPGAEALARGRRRRCPGWRANDERAGADRRGPGEPQGRARLGRHGSATSPTGQGARCTQRSALRHWKEYTTCGWPRTGATAYQAVGSRVEVASNQRHCG